MRVRVDMRVVPGRLAQRASAQDGKVSHGTTIREYVEYISSRQIDRSSLLRFVT